MMGPGWYLRRLSRMGPREIAGRVGAAARVRRWRATLDRLGPAADEVPGPAFATPLPAGVLTGLDPRAVARLVAGADRIMDGHAVYFGVARDDMVSPDWSFDPKTGRRAPADAYAFDVPYRDEEAVGDVKQLWEPSRHQHLTVLAAAYAATGDDRYAERVADHLKSWWAANPPLRGVHWLSGIELGIRLISWVWTRRLLEGWPGAAGLFEHNPEARLQVFHHQRWLAAFPSRGSSANNHVIAEAAGQLAAACAFPWFAHSAHHAREALHLLDTQLRHNTCPSGINRELASEYHGLVLELGLVGAAEATAAGLVVPRSTWLTLLRMSDALAAVLDSALHPPRQGDSDDGHAVVLDGPGTHRWASLLATGAAVFGARDWWPDRGAATDVRTPLLAALAGGQDLGVQRPGSRPARFADAGLTVLRGRDRAGAEIWCRCDGGPHGFLSIAAHAHADALSVEVRHDGVDVLADPGTYCYHGEPDWRRYFRSTLGHNTLELDGTDQSVSGGPFLWTRHVRTTELVADITEGAARWTAEHDGYGRPGRPVHHRRTVELVGASGELRILDEVRSSRPHRARLAFHLGPRIAVALDGHRALLSWEVDGGRRDAVLHLPEPLGWTAHRGETGPPLGWYSPGFGRRVPSVTLVGAGVVSDAVLATRLGFGPGQDAREGTAA